MTTMHIYKRYRVLEKVRMRTLYFEKVLQIETVHIKNVRQSKQQSVIIQSDLFEVAVAIVKI